MLPPGEDALIRVAISRQRALLSILFENSWDPRRKAVPGKDGLPATTKEDAGFHGYGLRNLKQAVERYQGTVFWEPAPQTFRLKILLSIPPE